MKRITALLLALLMVLTLVTGCSEKETESEEETGSTAGQAEHKGGDGSDANPGLISGSINMLGEAEDYKDYWLCEEKTTLTVTTYDGVNATYLPPSNDEWFWQTLEKYTNVHIEWDVCSYSSYNEVMNVRLAAGTELSDIIFSNGVKSTANAGNSGVLVDLAPYWDTCFTNTQNYFDTIDVDLLSLIKNPGGEIYSLPNTMNPTESHIIFMYNTQWMEELGAEVPTTLDEFTALLYKMQAAGDLNHNGVKDEVILTSDTVSTIISVLGNAFNLEQYEGWDSFSADAEGNVYSEYTCDNMKACLTYLNQLYEDGVLDNEICTLSADDMAEKIANDRVGCFVYYSGFAVSYGMMTSAGQEDPMGEYYTLGLPLASEYNNNEAYLMRRTIAYGNTGAAITYECENVELACKWLDTLYADPNILWARVYGKQGETWDFDENGEVKLLATDDSGQWDPYYLGVGQISLPFIQTTEESVMDARQWYLDECDAIRECKWVSASVPKVSIFSEEENELRDEVQTEVMDCWYEWRDQFVTGMKDIETQWDNYVKTINGMGMKQLVEVWQMVYDRLK